MCNFFFYLLFTLYFLRLCFLALCFQLELLHGKANKGSDLYPFSTFFFKKRMPSTMKLSFTLKAHLKLLKAFLQLFLQA